MGFHRESIAQAQLPAFVRYLQTLGESRLFLRETHHPSHRRTKKLSRDPSGCKRLKRPNMLMSCDRQNKMMVGQSAYGFFKLEPRLRVVVSLTMIVGDTKLLCSTSGARDIFFTNVLTRKIRNAFDGSYDAQLKRMKSKTIGTIRSQFFCSN